MEQIEIDEMIHKALEAMLHPQYSNRCYSERLLAYIHVIRDCGIFNDGHVTMDDFDIDFNRSLTKEDHIVLKQLSDMIQDANKEI
jgi:hypothetical protein